MRLSTLLALVLVACTPTSMVGPGPYPDAAEDRGPVPQCVSGMQIACACRDGAMSVQRCGDDGRYAPCDCAEPSLDAGTAEDVQYEDVPVATDAPPDLPTLDVSCPAGRTRCGLVCVDTATDGTNCGGCGIVCGLSSMCEAGQCIARMAGDAGVDVFSVDVPRDSGAPRDVCRFVCDGGCVDSDTDPRNCGRCGNDCTSLPGVDRSRVTCEGGQCSVSRACLAGRLNCSGNPSTGCETSVNTSFRCGSCTRGCTEPTSVCVISSGSPTGFACGTDCTLPLNARCGGTCVNIDTDPRNCGRCRAVCPSGRECRMGVCQ